MELIKKNWYLYLYLILIIFIGLYLNHFSFSRLPFGEDDVYYFGTIRRFFVLGLGNLNFINLVMHLDKIFLFYLLFLPWRTIRDFVPILNYYNFLYLIFYIGGLLSFLRLTKLGDTKINRYLIPLFYVLLVSNSFWLGPRYFVPSLWLYIAIPNIIYSTLKKKYIESIIWTIITLFFYSFGFTLAILVFITSTIITHLKPVWLKFIASLIIFAIFYFFGMKYVGNFINNLNVKSIIESDLGILNWFYFVFMSIVILSLLVSILYKLPIYWDQIFVAILLFFIFYIVASSFPKDAPTYRLIIILYCATALALNSFPNVFANRNWLHLCLGVMMTLIVIYYAFQLFIYNIDQINMDSIPKSILPEEISLFEEINNNCQSNQCLIISDPATMQLGSYYSPIFSEFNLQNLQTAVSNPLDFENTPNYQHVILIVSKRTTQIFANGITYNGGQVSRSYQMDSLDPLLIYGSLINIPNPNKELYYNTNLGLYAYWLK